MKRILVTGATGNVGIELIRYLSQISPTNQIIAGVRNKEKARELFSGINSLQFVDFDFENPAIFDRALQNIDSIFLLRPPHLSDIKKYFKPLIEKIKASGVSEVIFLSVQGAEKSKVIPHHKIEKLILDNELDHIFVRPAYFMQNLTSELLEDIQVKRKIILPAGKTRFNWIDVNNIGEICAILINQFPEYKNQAIELTGSENANFYQVRDLINEVVPDEIEYVDLNPLRYFWLKKREGMPVGKILVMIMLHFLPRFQNDPKISRFYQSLTGKEPTTLEEFIERERQLFNKKPL